MQCALVLEPTEKIPGLDLLQPDKYLQISNPILKRLFYLHKRTDVLLQSTERFDNLRVKGTDLGEVVIEVHDTVLQAVLNGVQLGPGPENP